MTRQSLPGYTPSAPDRSTHESQAGQPGEETACSSSAASEGWEQINVADDFSISVSGTEARITYDDKLVAKAVLSNGDVSLRLESSLQGRRTFPMAGFMKAYKKAEDMLSRA